MEFVMVGRVFGEWDSGGVLGTLFATGEKGLYFPLNWTLQKDIGNSSHVPAVPEIRVGQNVCNLMSRLLAMQWMMEKQCFWLPPITFSIWVA